MPSGDIMDVPMEMQLRAAQADQAPLSAQTATIRYESIEQKYVFTPASAPGPLARGEVREALANARAAGTLVPSGEIGDTTKSIAARDAFNDLQAQVILARWNDEARVMAKAAAAERAALLAQQEIEAVIALGARADTEWLALNPVARREIEEQSTEQVLQQQLLLSPEERKPDILK